MNAHEPLTGNPASFVQYHHPRAFEEAYRDWLFAQLSRMPYLCKGLVRQAICQYLVPELSRALDRLIVDARAEGWRLGYDDAQREVRS